MYTWQVARLEVVAVGVASGLFLTRVLTELAQQHRGHERGIWDAVSAQILPLMNRITMTMTMPCQLAAHACTRMRQ